MKKRIVSVLLAAVMVLSLLPVTGWAAESNPAAIRSELPDEAVEPVTKATRGEGGDPAQMYELEELLEAADGGSRSAAARSNELSVLDIPDLLEPNRTKNSTVVFDEDTPVVEEAPAAEELPEETEAPAEMEAPAEAKSVPAAATAPAEATAPTSAEVTAPVPAADSTPAAEDTRSGLRDGGGPTIVVNTGAGANVAVEVSEPKPKVASSDIHIVATLNNPNIDIVVSLGTNVVQPGSSSGSSGGAPEDGWWEQPWNGEGTKDDPFLIENAGNLRRLGEAVELGNSYSGCYFLLTDDIDITEYCEKYEGYPWRCIGTPDHPFRGFFDGGGHTVSGLKITNGGDECGLFGRSIGTIFNLNVEGEVKGGSCVGGIVGANLFLMFNCTFNGSVTGTGKYIGGVAGYTQGLLYSCTNNGTVQSTGEQIGGVTGRNERGVLRYCINNGSVDTDTSKAQAVGGVVGLNYRGDFTCCQNYGTVKGYKYVGGVIGQAQSGASFLQNYGQVEGQVYVGGVMGDTMGDLSQCENYGIVYGRDSVGGITGWLDPYTLSDCTNLGKLYIDCRNGIDAGGIVGYCNNGTIRNCINNGSLTRGSGNAMGIKDVGGIAGRLGDGLITHCVNAGTTYGYSRIGGITGDVSGGTVEYCYNYSPVYGYDEVGGISGFVVYDNGTIRNCRNSASVSGNRSAGGITGMVMWDATIKNCVNTGDIDGFSISNSDGGRTGGISGRIYEANAINNYSSGIVTAYFRLGGVFGQVSGDSSKSTFSRNYYYRFDSEITGIGRWKESEYLSSEIKGLSEKEIRKGQTLLNFVGWDFEDTWYNTSEGPELYGFGIEQTGGRVEIGTAVELRHLSARIAGGDRYENATVVLTADIDLSDVPSWSPIGMKSDLDHAFGGVFDGNGYTITANQKLFGTVTGTVKNLTVIGSISDDTFVGGIVGELTNGTMENCRFIGSINGDGAIGGLVGEASHATILDCLVHGTVQANKGSVGGLVGLSYGSTIERCTANVEVIGGDLNPNHWDKAYWVDDIGGLIGMQGGGTTKDCIHLGDITGVFDIHYNGDGIDEEDSSISRKIGGCVGEQLDGYLINCCHYSGQISGGLGIGGVVGNLRQTLNGYSVVRCYYLSGTTPGGVDVGVQTDSAVFTPNAQATALTHTDFQIQESFEGWDFNDVWGMCADHPTLIDSGMSVSFRPNGGTGSMNDQVLPAYGVELPKCTYTREGYTFVGWSTQMDAGGDFYEDEATVSGIGELFLYAIWSQTEDVAYCDENGDMQTAENCRTMRVDLAGMSDGWYYAEGSFILSRRVEIHGDVKLIIKDGSRLNVPMGFHVPEGCKLTIYGQGGTYTVPETSVKTSGNGTLTVSNLTYNGDACTNSAAIGGNADETAGDICLVGGIILVTAENGAAIGGGLRGDNGTVSIFNAYVNARGGQGSAGIGGGFGGNGGAVELNGGYTWAVGGTVVHNGVTVSGCGIGAGAPILLDEGQEGLAQREGATVGIRNAYVHAEAGPIEGSGYRANAIGQSFALVQELENIYPLVHVQAIGEDGTPADWNEIPYYCTRQSVDIRPCLGHRGTDENKHLCRYCGSTETSGVRFVTFDYNYTDAPDGFSYGVEEGYALKITSDISIPDDKYFLGWNTAADGTATWCYPGQLITPTGSLTLYAQWAELVETSYQDGGRSQTVQALRITENMYPVLRDRCTYIAEGELSFNEPLQVNGSVNLILADGCTLNANRGILVNANASLTIYGQEGRYAVPGETDFTTTGTGVLNARGYQSSAGIGGSSGWSSGHVFIEGGVIHASATYGAGIGGGDCGSTGILSINDGCVYATGGGGSAGIGGGRYASAYKVIICGGYVHAVGSELSGVASAAIGAGISEYTQLTGGDFYFYGGTLIAETAAATVTGQAIGVSNSDASGSTTSYNFSEYDHYRAYNAENATLPVSAADRINTCKSSYVRLERCTQHYGSGDRCVYCDAEYSNVLDLKGSGDEENPYRVGCTADWNELARYIQNGGDTAGRYFVQIVGFQYGTQLGTAQNPFKGIFDGKTDFTLTNDWANAAPFAYIEDATIYGVHTIGTINTDQPYASGLVDHAAGTCVIDSCRPTMTINSSVSGAGYHGGLIGECAAGSDVTITGCAFDGEITGTETTNCGGFVGRAENCTLTITNSMMGAVAFEPASSQTYACVNANTTLTMESCYYLDVKAEGSAQGTRAYTVTGDPVFLVRADGAGFGWDNLLGGRWAGKLFAAEGETVVFTSSYGSAWYLYAEETWITQDGDCFTLTMPAEDVTVHLARDYWFGIDRETGLDGGYVTTNYQGAHPCDTVLIICQPNKAWLFGSVSVTDAQGNEVPVELAEIDEETDMHLYRFTMPGSAVHVTGSFLPKTSFDETTNTLYLLRGDFNYDWDNNWGGYNTLRPSRISNVVAEPGVRFVGDCHNLFDAFIYCASFDLHNVDTSEMTNASYMFRICYSMTSLNLTGWDVSKVTDINHMFYRCESMTTFDVDLWADAPLEDANHLFEGCSGLQTLDLSALRLRDINPAGIFYGADALHELTLALGTDITEEMELNNTGLGWVEGDTVEVECYGEQYASFSAHANPTVWHWATDVLGERWTYDSETHALTLRWGPFDKDSEWHTAVNKNDVHSVTALPGVRFEGDCSDMFYMFTNCTSMDLNAVDTEAVTDMSEMFIYCGDLTSLDLSNWDTSNVTSLQDTFAYCRELRSLDLRGWDVSKVTSMYETFVDCENLETLDLTGWDPQSAETMYNMFCLCMALESLDLSGWHTGNVTDMNMMFGTCSSLTSLNVSGWDTADVVDMGRMFSDCSALTALNLSDWDTSALANCYGMFQNCSALTELHLGGWDVSNIAPPVDEYGERPEGWEDPLIYIPEEGGTAWMFSGADALRYLTLPAGMAITEDMCLNNGENDCGWVVRGDENAAVVSGSESCAVIAAPAGITPYVWGNLSENQNSFASLTLAGDIGVNFFVDLTGIDMLTGQMVYSWGSDVNGDPHTDTASLEGIVPESGGTAAGYFRVPAHVAAKEMNDTITATLMVGSQAIKSVEYSVLTYAQQFYEDPSRGEPTDPEKQAQLKELMRTMLIYGAAAQQQFDYNTEALVSAGLADKTLTPLSDAEKDALVENNIGDLTGTGLTYVGTSLLLKSETVYRLYFTGTAVDNLRVIAENAPEEVTVTIGTKGSYTYVDIAGIPAKNILDTFTLQFGIRDGETFTELARCTCSAGAYIKSVLADDPADPTLVNTVTALYRYCKAAQAYFDATSA